MLFCINVSALGNGWYTAIMNCANEVTVDESVCNGGVLGIQGSANFDPVTNFNFSDAYTSNFSGMLCDIVTQDEVSEQ